MVGSSWGYVFRLTTFGESHGVGLGGVVDGCPAGLALQENFIQERLNKRRPGGLSGADVLAGTKRKEKDAVALLSGVFEGKTTGTPIAFVVYNEDQRSKDYGELAHTYRPGHADMTYDAKYGVRDYRGGGRSSGRETLSRVAGGAIAEAFLASMGIELFAATVEVGGLGAATLEAHVEPDMKGAEQQPFFSAYKELVQPWQERVEHVRKSGDTLGGIVRIEARQVPAGLGEPVFQKLDAMLAAALMSVGAVKGVEIGAGFAAARKLGSENNDTITGLTPPTFASNHAGGILGGISSGQDIILHAAIKPIPSIAHEQDTVTSSGQNVKLRVGGRHDICAIPRVVPVLKAMVALTLADAVLMQRRLEP